MRTKVLILLLSLCCSVTAQVREGIEKTHVYQGFSGGMMLHAGYLFGRDSHAPVSSDGQSISPQGGTFGIGGALRVHLWHHLRVGFEGFVSTMPSGLTDRYNLLASGSYLRTGCGGVLADCCWRLDKAWPYIGGTIGGGSLKGLYILEGDQNSWAPDSYSIFHKESFFYVAPYVGCDYCITRKVHITLRLDWVLAVHKNELVLPTGPRVYFGFMFCH